MQEFVFPIKKKKAKSEPILVFRGFAQNPHLIFLVVLEAILRLCYTPNPNKLIIWETLHNARLISKTITCFPRSDILINYLLILDLLTNVHNAIEFR